MILPPHGQARRQKSKEIPHFNIRGSPDLRPPVIVLPYEVNHNEFGNRVRIPPRKSQSLERKGTRMTTTTIPGKGWFVHFGIYGPEQPAFGRGGKPEDFEVVNSDRQKRSEERK